MRISIIGHGNVATSLQAAFAAKGLMTPLISAHRLLHTDTSEGNATVANDESNTLASSDVVIYAVPDAVLEQVVQSAHTQPRTLHLHTAGSMTLEVFGSDKPHSGILYPFQSFSKAEPLSDWSEVPIFIEARGIDDISAVYTIALMLSAHVIEANTSERAYLHLAGVFANNFTNAMYSIAEQILRQHTHIPFSVLLPLIDRTAGKIHSLSPKQAQTGPARRGDEQVLQQHLNLLTDPNQQQIYQLLTEIIRNSDLG